MTASLKKSSVLVVMLLAAACSGVRETTFTVNLASGAGTQVAEDALRLVVDATEPELVEMGFRSHGGPWFGVGRVEVAFERGDDAVVVTVRELVSGISLPSTEYRRTRGRLKVLLIDRFGERNVAVNS